MASNMMAKWYHSASVLWPKALPKMLAMPTASEGAPPVRDRSHAFGPRLLQVLAERAPVIDLRCWDPASEPDPAARTAAVAGARIVVLANEHAALADPGVLAGAAPGAVVYDMCGVLGAQAGTDIVLRRFGQGGSSAV